MTMVDVVGNDTARTMNDTGAGVTKANKNVRDG
jgi:hypothetical protein